MNRRRAAGTPARWAWSALIAGAIVAGAPSAPAAGGVAVAERASGRPAAVREYWNERRMRRAEPAVISLGSGKRAQSSARASDVSAASAGFPERVHGKVFFTVNGGSQPGDYVCSGTVVHSNSHTAVLTAGHCVDDPEFGGDFAVNWIFVPGYRSGSQPNGEWPAAQLLTTGPWQSGADVRQDLGIALVARDAEGRGIEDVVGARPIEFGLARQQAFAAFGYPALPTLFDPTFDGQRLYRCDSGVTGSDTPPGAGPDPLEIECDMSGGASGGGWVNAEGALNGLTSYGYAGDFSHLYGPYFGSEARTFYERALRARAAVSRARGDQPRRRRCRRLRWYRGRRRLPPRRRGRRRHRQRRRRSRVRRSRVGPSARRRRRRPAAGRLGRRSARRRTGRGHLHRRPGARSRPRL